MCEIMEKFGEKIRLQSMAEGRFNTLVELVRDGMLDVQKAAQKSGMSLEAFQKLVTNTI